MRLALTAGTEVHARLSGAGTTKLAAGAAELAAGAAIRAALLAPLAAAADVATLAAERAAAAAVEEAVLLAFPRSGLVDLVDFVTALPPVLTPPVGEREARGLEAALAETLARTLAGESPLELFAPEVAPPAREPPPRDAAAAVRWASAHQRVGQR